MRKKYVKNTRKNRLFYLDEAAHSQICDGETEFELVQPRPALLWQLLAEYQLVLVQQHVPHLQNTTVRHSTAELDSSTCCLLRKMWLPALFSVMTVNVSWQTREPSGWSTSGNPLMLIWSKQGLVNCLYKANY